MRTKIASIAATEILKVLLILVVLILLSSCGVAPERTECENIPIGVLTDVDIRIEKSTFSTDTFYILTIEDDITIIAEDYRVSGLPVTGNMVYYLPQFDCSPSTIIRISGE